MIRALVLALCLLFASIPAFAQQEDPGAKHPWSVSTGIGFASSLGGDAISVSGFNWQLDGQYRITDSVSVGAYMQVIAPEFVTLFNFAADVRYNCGFLHSNSNEVLSKLTPYGGIGMGLAHGSIDNFNVSDNVFLMAFIVGVEYDLTEHIALTSDMRFNILAPKIAENTGFGDRFTYTWQIIGTRYRF